jgi:hypothetical protein
MAPAAPALVNDDLRGGGRREVSVVTGSGKGRWRLHGRCTKGGDGDS